MTDPSPYAVDIEALEATAHVPVDRLVESVPSVAMPHDLPADDIERGRALPPRS